MSVAEIGGPFRVDEAINGLYGVLDPESRNNLLGPAPPTTWPDDAQVWRVGLTGPNGSESIVLSMDGMVIGWVVQGH
jgi:hypothetical protein